MGLPPSNTRVQRTVMVLSFTSRVSTLRGLGRPKEEEMLNTKFYSAGAVSRLINKLKKILKVI